MSFLWSHSSGDPRLAEYARAYERAITTGSIDSAISWELGGFKAKDGTVLTDAPEGIKEMLMKNPKYLPLMLRVISAVKALRASRDMAGFAPHTQTSENRV